MNISPATIAALKEQYSVIFSDANANDATPEKAADMNIGFSLADHRYIGKCIKATKKETTFECVMAKINADSAYKNLCSDFAKLLPAGLNAYPTTYGIGVWVAFGIRAKIDETKAFIDSKLTAMGINYTCEFSDASWVFRYKISKAAANLSKI